MTVLVTGGTGLVGTRLLRRLVDAGIECRALVRAGKELPAGVTPVEGDLLEPATLPEAVEGVSAVIHLAAVLRTPEPALIEQVNVTGTKNLIEAALIHAPAARVIMASTNLVYDEDLSRPAREEDPANAKQPYPATKIVAERLLRESGLTWSVLRFAFVYGDADGHLQSAPQLLRSWGWHPAATMSLIHHRDIATAILLALSGAMDGRVVNLSDDAPTTVYEIARIVGAEYTESAEPLQNPWKGHVDGTLARELGFRPVIRSVHQAAAEGVL
ncbi:NAD(P)-dependent oxidoreductase [Amycolatopsis sp. ATCC 39116]|uniref:NAD-dependent epimerase/dehydratase family protein n=1 Tax=Amycolatopsis sp. (strain ATCC 39116 / 75iv2) TaxID=385957 RepID=UPI000262613C|nr:NAD(P)-dependent oxidoreductase [Amycolatopsis sp. ATCC 39116]